MSCVFGVAAPLIAMGNVLCEMGRRLTEKMKVVRLTNYRATPTMASRLWLSVWPGLFFWEHSRRWEIS